MIISTFFLYFFIMIVTSLFAMIAQNNKKGIVTFHLRWLLCSFFIHWFFCAFTNIGVDYPHYKNIIRNYSLSLFMEGEEIGFNGLSAFLYYITKNEDICIFFIKTLTMVLFYLGFYKLKDKIQLWMCILSYNVFLYLSSFYLISIHVAIAFVFLGAAMAFTSKNMIGPIALATVGFSFHASAIIMVVCFISILLVEYTQGRKFNSSIFYVLIAFLFLVVGNVNTIYRFALASFNSFEHYEDYSESTHQGNSGLYYYFLYTFYFLYLLLIFKSKIRMREKISSMMFYLFGFMFGMLVYILGSGRLNMYTIVFTGITVPVLFNSADSKYQSIKKVLKIIWVLYLFVVGYQSLNSFTDSKSTAELYKYEYFNPFKSRG